MSIIADKIQYKIKPYNWQVNTIRNTENVSEYALFAEVGAGKTCAMVNMLRVKYYKHGRMLRTLIISPLVTLYNWKNEIKLHSTVNDKDILVLDSASKRIKQAQTHLYNQLSGKYDVPKIVVINYESVMNAQFFDILKSWQPEVVILDEMHYIKNHKSKRSKKILDIGDSATYRFGMTGTPILNTPMDIYNQYRFLDRGDTFGRNFFVFRNRYFQDTNARWQAKQGYFPKFEAIPEMFTELTDLIYRKAVRVTKEQCLDLPPLIKKKVIVPMNAAQMKAYKEMKDQFITYVHNELKTKTKAAIATTALTKALRLQQIISGFITDEDGNEQCFEDVPRMSVLKELLTELVPQHKVIVWCSFKNNYPRIGKICDELGVGCAYITGEQSLADKQEAMDRLKSDDKCRVIIANRRAGGIGINLIEAAYSIVYSRNFSLGEEIQSEARNYRGGSQIHERVVKIDICCPDSIDELVIEALAGKQEVSDKIIDGKF